MQIYKEWYKSVGAVVYTRYHQYIDIDSIPSIECQSSHPGKSDNISSEDYIWLQCMASQVMSINLYPGRKTNHRNEVL